MESEQRKIIFHEELNGPITSYKILPPNSASPNPTRGAEGKGTEVDKVTRKSESKNKPSELRTPTDYSAFEGKEEYPASQLLSPYGDTHRSSKKSRLEESTQRFPFASLEEAAKATDLSKKETKLRDKNVFLLKQAESLPLYASWDDELRKLILTNRFQSRIKASYTYSAEQDFPSFAKLGKQSRTSKAKEVLEATRPVQSMEGKDSHSTRSLVSFTAWPLPNPLRSVPTLDSKILQKKNIFNELFEKQSDSFNSKNQFLFPTQSLKEPATNDMINALLQWQKLIKDNKQLSKEDKQAAKEKVSYWPKNVRRANWSTELMDNDIEFDEPPENGLKKQTILWEFIPPNYGGFIWPGIK